MEQYNFDYKSPYGEEVCTLTFSANEYIRGGRLQVQIHGQLHGEDYKEPFCSLTTNIIGYNLKQNEVFLDTNNCPAEIVNRLEADKMFQYTGLKVTSGHYAYPIVALSDAFLKDIGRSDLAIGDNILGELKAFSKTGKTEQQKTQTQKTKNNQTR